MNVGAALGYAVTIVNDCEGFYPAAFLDTLATEPVWTLGHGSTRINGEPVQPGTVCTREQADLWAMSDMTAAAHYVLHEVTVPLTDHQLGALISFCYNIGDGHFRSSSVLEALNLGLYAIAADRLLEYDEAGGIIRSGLEMRRGRERALFLLGCPQRGPFVLHPAGPAASGTAAMSVVSLLNKQAQDMATAKSEAAAIEDQRSGELGSPSVSLASAKADETRGRQPNAREAEMAREDAETDALNQAELDRIAKGTSVG
jgi:lysozyme